jgi:hypothetical protein
LPALDPTWTHCLDGRRLTRFFRGTMLWGVSPAYLSQKLTRPLPTKDGGTLRTILDTRAYMLALPKRRETSAQWQRAAELLLAQADVAAFSKAVELALFYDAKLDVSKAPAK